MATITLNDEQHALLLKTIDEQIGWSVGAEAAALAALWHVCGGDPLAYADGVPASKRAGRAGPRVREGVKTKAGKRRPRAVPTIEQIRAFKWAGNHAADSGKMDAIDAYVREHHKSDPVTCKEALTILTRDGMGVRGECDDNGLRSYLAERP